MAKHWTAKEEQSLMQGVGIYGIAWFRKHGGNAYDWPNALEGRSVNACYSKARRLFGKGGLSRGSYSLNEIVKKTGYSKTHIRRAMKALAQKWKRLSPAGSYLIYEDQLDDIVGWLENDYWAPLHRLYNCFWCHNTAIRHEGKGLCLRCYWKYMKRLQRANLPSDNKKLLCIVKGVNLEPDEYEKTVKSLNQGRALPEGILEKLID